MEGSHVLGVVKVGLAAALAAIANHLGGFDRYLMLLVLCILTDLVTGFFKAVVKKNLASREMMVGIIRKVLIMVCVCLSFEINAALMQYATESGMNYKLDLRIFVILYFVLEELLSILENMVVIGVPVPKFVTQFLRVVVEATNSTPSKMIEIFGKLKKLDWLGLAETVKEDEKAKEDEKLKEPKADNEPVVHDNLVKRDDENKWTMN